MTTVRFLTEVSLPTFQHAVDLHGWGAGPGITDGNQDFPTLKISTDFGRRREIKCAEGCRPKIGPMSVASAPWEIYTAVFVSAPADLLALMYQQKSHCAEQSQSYSDSWTLLLLRDFMCDSCVC